MAEGTAVDGGAEQVAAGGAGGEAGGGSDFGPIFERFDQLGASVQDIGERVGQFEHLMSSGEEFGFAEEPDLASMLGLGGAGDEYGYEPDAMQAEQAQRVLQLIGQRDQAMQQQLASIGQELADLRLARGAEDLEQRYPELQEPDAARAAVQAATQWAEGVGQPELALNPSVVELVYKASKADERAAAEVPAGGEGFVRLEGGGGAVPAPNQVDDATRIVQAGGGSTAWF